MVYRFKIMSDEAPDFRLEIQIDSYSDFRQLRDTLLHAAGYDTLGEADTFFICDDDWTPRIEIALDDIGSDSDVDVYVMDETILEDLIEEEGQRLTFCYDADDPTRFFLMEMREMLPGRKLSSPLCTLRRGIAPPRTKPKTVVVPPKAPSVQNPTVFEEIGLEFYGDDDFDVNELPEGMDQDDIEEDLD